MTPPERTPGLRWAGLALLVLVWEAVAWGLKTPLFVTHDLEKALFLSDRVFALNGGAIETIVGVPFRRPRVDELRTMAEFQDMERQLWKYLGAGEIDE